MTTTHTKAQLATILSALAGEAKRPGNAKAALSAIEQRAAKLGLTTDEVLQAAPGLLDGRLSPTDWLAEVTDAAQEKVAKAKKPTSRVPLKLVAALDPQAPAETPQDRIPCKTEAQAERAARIAKAKDASKARRDAKPRKAKKVSRIAEVEALMRRGPGATMGALMAATGWQQHTLRAAIATQLRAKKGLLVETTRQPGEAAAQTVYRIKA